MAVNVVTIGGYSAKDPPRPEPVNWFCSTTGAGRFGFGRFLLLRSDVEAILESAGTDPVNLVLGDHRGPMLTIPVYPISAVPYVYSTGGDEGLVILTVYDRRYEMDVDVSGAYNVQKDGFPYDGASPSFVASSLNGGSEWTWSTMAVDLGLPAIGVAPSWKPRNVVVDGWQRHRAADWIAANLCIVVALDRATSLLTWHSPGVMTSANSTLLAASVASGLFASGGTGLRNTSRLPDQFNVQFPGFNDDDPADPFAQQAYSVLRTVGGSTNRIQPLHVGSHVAVYSGAAWLETTNLDAIAADLATRAYAFINVTPAAYEFSGIVPFSNDGAIRRIVWSSEPAFGGTGGGAKTRIYKSVQFDWSQQSNGGLWGHSDAIAMGASSLLEYPSDQLTMPISGNSGGIDVAGTRRIWQGAPDVTVIAKVDSAATGGGYYVGTIYKGAASASGSSNAALPEGMTAGDACLILHTVESGLPTHWFKLNTYVVGKVIGRTTGTPEKWIVATGNGTFKTASPPELSGTGDTADTATWDREVATSGTDYGDGPVSIKFVGRVYWDSATNTLVQFFRTAAYDSAGHLKSVSAEALGNIDTTEDCP